MAFSINYVPNPLITEGNTPLDGRTVVTFDEMTSIEYPFNGMQVYVIEEKTTYLITEDCMITNNRGKMVMNPDLEVIRKNAAKIATSDNIQGMMNGDTFIGPSGQGVEKRYCLGTIDGPDNTYDRMDREPDGWDLSRPTPSASRPYVWSIEATLKWNATLEQYELVEPGWSADALRENGEAGPAGADGSNFRIIGNYTTYAELVAAVTNPKAGDAYAVGTSQPYDIYLWDDNNDQWVNHGALQGAKGDKGDPAWKSITKFVFKSTASANDPFATPGKPQGGSYDFTTGEFTNPSNWQSVDSSLAKPIWMSSRTFIENDNTSTWSDPIMITGVDGTAGEDGIGIEYAYKRVASEKDAPKDTPKTITEGGNDGNGWYDNPQGVTETLTCEYVSIRTGFYKDGGQWSTWSTPTLWSKYGANGQDGDGVEYIYYVSNDAEAPVNPTPKEYSTMEDYNKSEWMPYDMAASYINIDNDTVNDKDMWSDDPWGVDKNNRFEYVSVRKKVNGTWGVFSEPKLWAKFSEDGAPGLAGQTATTAYVDNPMDSVLNDANGKPSAGFPCITNFKVFHGTEELNIKSFTVVPSEALTENTHYTKSVSGTKATLTVNSLPTSESSKVTFTLKATVDIPKEVGSIEKEFIGTFLINKISAAAPNIVVDMANDNINVPCDSNKVVIDGIFPVKNIISAYEGSTAMNILGVTCPDSNVTLNYSNKEVSVSIKNFTADTYTVNLDVELEGAEPRRVSFNIIKVIPGAAGEAAKFYEIKPNFSVIKVDTDGKIVNKTLDVNLIYHVGASTEVKKLSEVNDAILYYSVDTDDYTSGLKVFPNNGLDLSNAITGDLDLDRYIALTLVQSGKVVDGPERLYMVHDGAAGRDGADGAVGSGNIFFAQSIGK